MFSPNSSLLWPPEIVFSPRSSLLWLHVLPVPCCRRPEVEQATGCFSAERHLGHSALGEVFSGHLLDRAVAITQLARFEPGRPLADPWLSRLSKLQLPYLLPLLGISPFGDLVYPMAEVS